MDRWKTVCAAKPVHRYLTVADVLDDVADRRFCDRVLEGFFLDLLDCVDDCGVVAAAELFADLDHGHLRDFADDVHGDLAREGDVRVAL